MSMSPHAGLAVATAAVALVAPTLHAQLDLGAPSDDVWAYDNAQNPGSDPQIRVWGFEGNEFNPLGYPCNCSLDAFYSYGFFSWSLEDVPPDFQWNGATVEFTITENTVYDPETNDVYLRVLTGPFDEDIWEFGQGPGVIGGETNRLLGDDSDVVNGEGSKIVFQIPASVPRQLLRQWARNGSIDLALTATADVANNGEILRIASTENVLFDPPNLTLR